MKLSKAQVAMFWRMWSKACQVQGWTRENGFAAAQTDAKRKDVLGRCGFSSLHDVDRSAGYGRVKAELESLAEKLAGAIESVKPELDEARRLHWRLNQDVLCLQLYLGEGSVAYVEAIARDKFDLPRLKPVDLDLLGTAPIPRVEPRTGALIEGPSQLLQLVMTVRARLGELRKIAGDTEHEMRLRAGAKCFCAACRTPDQVVAL